MFFSSKRGSRHFRLFYSGTKGAAAVEYAIVAPVLFFLIIGIIQYNVIIFGITVLEGATIAAARAGATLSTGGYSSQSAYIKSILASNVGGLLDANKAYSNLSTVVYNTSDDYANSNPESSCSAGNPCFGAAGEVVVYTIKYPWPIVAPLFSTIFGSGGIYTISTNMIVQNEP